MNILIKFLILSLGSTEAFSFNNALKSRKISFTSLNSCCQNRRCSASSASEESSTTTSSQLPSIDAIMSARDARIVAPLTGGALNLIIDPTMAGAEDTPDALSVKNHLEKYFPSVMKISTLQGLLKTTLPNYTKSNTLLCTSFCSDEVNQPFIQLLSQTYGDSFSLGGLGGIPFVGNVGMGAAVSHIPDQGNCLIVLGSHVGFSRESGLLGKVKRGGREALSTACGAAIPALFKVQQGIDPVDNGIEDVQEDWITNKLIELSKGKKFPSQADAIAWVTYVMHDLVKERVKGVLEPLLKGPNFSNQRLALLGGVLLNLGPGEEDLFQPIFFEVSGKDKFREAFGYASVNSYAV